MYKNDLISHIKLISLTSMHHLNVNKMACCTETQKQAKRVVRLLTSYFFQMVNKTQDTVRQQEDVLVTVLALVHTS